MLIGGCPRRVTVILFFFLPVFPNVSITHNSPWVNYKIEIKNNRDIPRWVSNMFPLIRQV